jgi:ABC-type multidrug transport system fused ATPase/permease subunit
VTGSSSGARVRAFWDEVVRACGRRAVARLLAWQVLKALTEGVGLALLVPVIQSFGGADDVSMPGTDVTVPVWLAFAAVVLVVVLRALAQWRSAVVGNDLQLRTTDALRLEALAAVFAARWEFIATQRRSHIVQSLTSEVMRAGAALGLLTRLLVGGLVLAVSAAVAVLISPAVGGLAVLSLVVVAAVARGSLRASSLLGVSLSGRNRAFGAVVTDSLASVRLIRAHDAAAGWLGLITEEAARGRETQARYIRSSSGIAAALGVAALAAALGLVLLARELGLGTAHLVALAVVSQRMLASAQSLLTQAQQFANLAPSLDGVRELTAQALAHREADPALLGAPVGSDTTVELAGVTVHYDGAPEPALLSIDLTLPPHGLVLVTGASGSGKSTLLDVLLGLVRPQQGEVRVGGEPLTDLTPWRARIGYVPQQNVLVPGTVLQNLVWSVAPGQHPTEDDAWAALEIACLDDVVRELPGGLHAELRELAELSGGEQQRLCLARALVRHPHLLLLDEATGALDPATEARVLARLAERPGLTVLVSHRPPPSLATTAHLHLDEGRLTTVVRP